MLYEVVTLFVEQLEIRPTTNTSQWIWTKNDEKVDFLR